VHSINQNPPFPSYHISHTVLQTVLPRLLFPMNYFVYFLVLINPLHELLYTY
jgi:hypothetical protein